jgi:Glycosyltransferase
MRIAFISAMAGYPWGGSEELWSQTAKALAEEGHLVMASVKSWPQKPPQIKSLRDAGIPVYERRVYLQRLLNRVARKLFPKNVYKRFNPRDWSQILSFRPDLVCISQGGNGCGVEWMQRCCDAKLPYATITQANAVQFWPDNHTFYMLREGFHNSVCNFFVSQANKDLLERQIGVHLQNYEIVRNPFGVSYDISLEWPVYEDRWYLACVGRFDPQSKGQDILIEVLSKEIWKNRPIQVSFYGSGPSSLSLQALIDFHGLHDMIEIKPYCDDVTAIWAGHHALVLPSRFEGLPLVVVEAMLCNRIPIVTDVAGNREVVEDDITGFVADAATPTHFENALERAWNSRYEWERMGIKAGDAIRQLVPASPARVFAQKLLKLI